MHALIRWFLRHVILLFSEEWGNAHQDILATQAVRRIRLLSSAELLIFKAALDDLERMRFEAEQALDRFPQARGVIEQMLQERARHLAHTVQQEASQASWMAKSEAS